MSILRTSLGSVTRLASRLGWAPMSLAAGVAATAVLALSTSGTLAAWTASIKHTGNSANSGVLTMQETGPASNQVVCNSTDNRSINSNAATCTGINHYGGATLVPGQATSLTVSVKNTGTIAANGFTITFAPCTQSNNTATGNVSGAATNLCDVMFMYVQVNINGNTTSPMTSGSVSLTTANNNGAYSLPTLAPGVTASVYFGIGLAGGTGIGNSYQGLTATQPFTFQFSS